MAVQILGSAAEVAAAAAAIVEAQAREAVAARGRFVFGLTGGRSPRALYRLLAQPAYSQRIPWAQTHVIWGDERFVPPDDPGNNAHLAITLLLDQVPVPATQVHRMPVEMPSVAAAAIRYEETLRRDVFADSLPRSDVLLLGLGDDGHVASLFPGAAALAERERWVVAVTGDDGPDRITLTLPVINAAALVVGQVCGAEKGRVLQRVLAGEGVPAGRVAPTAGRLLWLVDAAAAAELAGDASG